jgi:hypothetical protein
LGRRSRKRATGAPAPPPADRAGAPARPSRRRPRAGERPPAPWGSFPLVELSVLVALVIGVVGFVTGGQRGALLLATAGALGSLAGLELSIREHFAGFRSHTTVLAAAVGVLALAVAFFARAPYAAMLAVGAAVFGVAFYLLREAFKRRSGGYGFR